MHRCEPGAKSNSSEILDRPMSISGSHLIESLERMITRKNQKKIVVLDRDHLGVVAKLSADQALEVITANSAGWYGSGTNNRISAIELRPPVSRHLPQN